MGREEFLKNVKKWRRIPRNVVHLHHLIRERFHILEELEVTPVRPIGSDCRIGID